MNSHHRSQRGDFVPSALPRDRGPLRQEIDTREVEEDNTPACLLWARDVQSLLNDDHGSELFEKYLEQENCDMTHLYFVYACNGLKLQEDQEALDKKARAIYKQFVKSGGLSCLSEDVLHELSLTLKSKEQHVPVGVFENARQEVEEYILKTTFARFIQSEMYLDYVQQCMEEGDEENEDSCPVEEEDDGEGYEEDALADISRSSAPLPSDSEDADDHDEVDDVEPTNNPQLPRRQYQRSYDQQHQQQQIPQHQNHHLILNNNNHIQQDKYMQQAQHLHINREIESSHSHSNPSQILMPTLREEDEFQNATFMPPPTTMVRKPPAPLPQSSKSIQRQKRQSQKSMRYAENMAIHRPPPNPYHVKSSAFVPPSAYNSELQSMSSGNYTDLDALTDVETKPTFNRRYHPHDVTERRSRSARPLNRDLMPHNVIPRTTFPVDNANLAERKPEEFFERLCRKLAPVILEREQQEKALQRMHGNTMDDELNSQSILDAHVTRVFKSPLTRTPRSPSPGGTGNGKRLPLKSPYQVNPTFTKTSVKKDDNDSAIYSSEMSTSTGPGGAPVVQPRRKPQIGVDSGCEDSVVMGANYNYSPFENVSDWINRRGNPDVLASQKHKNKSSIHSGSNRSSCKSVDESKKKKQGGSSGKEAEIAIGYLYPGDKVPFVIRMPAKQLRLREFKNLLTKKGNYRYFFKTSSNEFGSDVVSEEIKDDNQILPLWEGKIYADIIADE